MMIRPGCVRFLSWPGMTMRLSFGLNELAFTCRCKPRLAANRHSIARYRRLLHFFQGASVKQAVRKAADDQFTAPNWKRCCISCIHVLLLLTQCLLFTGWLDTCRLGEVEELGFGRMACQNAIDSRNLSIGGELTASSPLYLEPCIFSCRQLPELFVTSRLLHIHWSLLVVTVHLSKTARL